MNHCAFDILLRGVFTSNKVIVERVGSSRDSSRDGGLSRPWDREKQRLGKRLFDGAMCRYEGHEVVDGRLVLRV
ncbi:MAG: hypothetical protein AAF561_06815, partial [Planctomycetota bacterium]